MVDLTDQEKAAIAVAMSPVGDIMAEIGWSTRLNELSREQVLMLIECAVTGFQEAMQATARNDREVPW